MTIPGTDLVRKESIEELCGHRARALTLYAQALGTLQDAIACHQRACYGGNSYPQTEPIIRIFQYPGSTRATGLDDTARKCIDRDMWRAFIIGTPLGSLMDNEERKKFESQVNDDPPPVDPDSVFATMNRLRGDAGVIFRRGLVNAFARLCRDYRSHDGFKIGDRVVFSGLVQNLGAGYRSISHYREPELRDVERCFYVLDGKGAPEYQQGILAAMRTEIGKGTLSTCEAETEYLKVRWFKNTNAHLWFKRTDLVARCNRMIAEHYGEALGMGPDAAKGHRP